MTSEMIPLEEGEVIILARHKSRWAYWLGLLGTLRLRPFHEWDDSLYVLTNRRLLCEQVGEIETIDLERVQNVTYSIPNPLRVLLSIGEIHIKTSDRREVMIWQSIGGPREVQAAIFQQVSRVRMERPVLIPEALRKFVEWPREADSVVLITRRHWFYLLAGLMWPALLLVLAGAVNASSPILGARAYLFRYFAIMMSTLGLLWGLWQFGTWINSSFTIHTTRIVQIERLPLGFRSMRAEVPLNRIQDVDVHIPVLGRKLGFGRVDITTTELPLVLTGLPRPEDFQRIILETLATQASELLRLIQTLPEPKDKQFAFALFLETIQKRWVGDLDESWRKLAELEGIIPPGEKLGSPHDGELADSLWRLAPERLAMINNHLTKLGMRRQFLGLVGIDILRWEEVVSFAAAWQDGSGAQTLATLEEATQRLTRCFAECLGAGLSSDQDSSISFASMRADLINVEAVFEGLGLASLLPLVYVHRQETTEGETEELGHLLKQLTKHSEGVAKIAVIFNLSTTQAPSEVEQPIRARLHEVYAFDTVFLGYQDSQKILGGRSPRQAFSQLILAHIDLTTVPAFVITGETPDNVFFGRELELRVIVEHISSATYAVIGGRRIGKTSVLKRLHRVRLHEAGFCSLYYDCATTSYGDFSSASIRDWQPKPTWDVPHTFGDLLHSPPSDRPLVLLLDEADKLVPYDRAKGWPLFNAFRGLANSGHAQIVFSGERTLRDALRDPKSPLFNSANEILLGPLERPAVEELITRPLGRLGIELVDEGAILSCIWNYTSGHPNVVQRLCYRLIRRLNEQGTRRLALDDVNAVIDDPRFQRDDFLGTYWEAATSLEKIISLLMTKDEDVRTLSTVRQALAERCSLRPKARDVDNALQRLVDLRSILKRTPNGYKFAVEAFPRVVAGTMTLDDMLEILTEEYQEQGE